MSQGFHHVKPHNHHPKHPHKFFDKSMYVIAMISPVMTVPQLLSIWQQHQAQGISLATWSAYCFVSFMWILYGIIHKDKLITFVNILLVALDGAIVVGALLFR